MLCFSPILRLGEPFSRFGYADDVSILVTGATTSETARKLQWELDETLAWGADNAISFDQDKAELIHFHYTRNQAHNESLNFEGQEIKPRSTIKWLGIHLDSRLSFANM
jgi:hypothetical protein